MHENLRHTTQRNRLDHLLPQGYLDGFSNPFNGGRLSVFDRRRTRWFDTGPAGAGAIRGFYDYSPGSEPDQTADQAFAQFETNFPIVRSELVASGFSGWETKLDFLLGFAQMLRVRCQLFREQHLAHSRQLAFARVEEVLRREPSRTRPGTFDTILKVGPCLFKNEAERETLLRNRTITDMRTEIANGPAWLLELHWCLQFTGNVEDPVITADTPVVVDGKAPTLEDALRDGATLVFFPICWRACLIGSPARFKKETDAFDSNDLQRLRTLYFKSARRFVFSPVRIPV